VLMRPGMAAHRRLVFDELVGKAADRAAKEAKRAARAAEAFTALLRDTKAITQDMPWEEAHVLVAGDRDYQAVSALLHLHRQRLHCECGLLHKNRCWALGCILT
jgi:FF domain